MLCTFKMNSYLSVRWNGSILVYGFIFGLDVSLREKER